MSVMLLRFCQRYRAAVDCIIHDGTINCQFQYCHCGMCSGQVLRPLTTGILVQTRGSAIAEGPCISGTLHWRLRKCKWVVCSWTV